jgi:hypothetical protein
MVFSHWKVTYKISVRTSQRMQCTSNTRISRWMQYWETVDVYSKCHTEYITTMYWQNCGFKIDGVLYVLTIRWKSVEVRCFKFT